jgi:hypothetical protein
MVFKWMGGLNPNYTVADLQSNIACQATPPGDASMLHKLPSEGSSVELQTMRNCMICRCHTRNISASFDHSGNESRHPLWCTQTARQ